MKIHSEEFRVPPGKEFKLADRKTSVKPFFQSKKQYQKILQDHVERLASLQQLHYARVRRTEDGLPQNHVQTQA